MSLKRGMTTAAFQSLGISDDTKVVEQASNRGCIMSADNFRKRRYLLSSPGHSLPTDNWNERRPKELLALGLNSEIYLLERVLRVGVAMVTSELR